MRNKVLNDQCSINAQSKITLNQFVRGDGELALGPIGRGGTRQCARPPPIVRAPATTFGTQV